MPCQPPRAGGLGAKPPGSRAFTLAELLVTLAIIVILMAISVGILSRLGQKEELEATSQALRGLLRSARNAARDERFPVTVEIDREASELRAHQKSAITELQFEVPGGAPGAGGAGGGEGAEAPPLEVEGARGYLLRLEHAELARGRAGLGALFQRSEPDAVSVGFIEDSPPLSPLEGVYFECWLQVGRLVTKLPRERPGGYTAAQEERFARGGRPAREPRRIAAYAEDDPPLFVVLRKGRAYSLAVTASYELEVALSGPLKDGQEGTFITRTGRNVIEAERWSRVAVAYDGRSVSVLVNGIPRVHRPVARHDQLPVRLLRDKAPLCLSDPHPERAFFGVLDEVRLAAVIAERRVPVPVDMTLISSEPRVVFDLLGQLDPARHQEPVVIYLTDDARLWELIAPPPQARRGGSMTRAELKQKEQQEKRLVGQDPYRRFLAVLPELDAIRVRRLIVDRSGLVTE